jgi:hypothetical protein
MNGVVSLHGGQISDALRPSKVGHPTTDRLHRSHPLGNRNMTRPSPILDLTG